MISNLVTLLVLVLIIGLVWWILTTYVTLPAPFYKIAGVIVAIIFVLLLVGILFGGVSLPHILALYPGSKVLV